MKKEKRPFGYLKEPKNLIHDFQERAKAGKALNPSALEKEDRTLYFAILREFDSFDDFLVEAGFDPEDVRIHQRWAFDKIKSKLDYLYENEIPFNYTTNGKKNNLYRGIVRALIYYFGNIEEGLNNFFYTRLESGYLARLCTRCKKNILDKKDPGNICYNCRGVLREDTCSVY